MTDADFNKRMAEIEGELNARGVPVKDRPTLAWFRFTNARTLDVREKDPSIGPYEKQNLYWSIWDWYAERFPHQTKIGHEWGPRLIMIRGEVFLADIPVHFNPTALPDASKFIRGLTPALWQLLGQGERAAIQETYSRFFAQGSDFAHTWTYWCNEPGLVGDLIQRGWSDLRVSCESFSPRDPGSVLFTAQQGPEKYLKAMLAAHDPTLTDRNLRDRYGHRIPNLLRSCTQLCGDLARFEPHISRLDYGADVRYRRETFSKDEVVGVVDLAHEVSHAVARHLLDLRLSSLC